MIIIQLKIGDLVPKVSLFLGAIAQKLAAKLSKPYSILMAKLRTDLAFRVLCDFVSMLRGSRQKFTKNYLFLQFPLGIGHPLG